MATTKARPRKTKSSVGSPPKPIGKIIGYGAAGLVALGLVAVMLNTPEKVPEGIPAGTQSIAVTDRGHVQGPVQYDQVVPAGGPHNPIPLDCGVYDVEVPKENAVHSLEHGVVWLTYRPEIGQQGINAVIAASRVGTKTIVSPIPDQPSPVMATAWGFQLGVDDPSDIRLKQFVQTFQDANTAPEPGASCTGGMAP